MSFTLATWNINSVRLREGLVVKLMAENPLYPPIVVKEGEELVIWGVVSRSLHKLY